MIFVLRAQAFDAWSEAAFEMILEARPRQAAIDVDVAGAKLKGAIDKVQSIARERGRQERAVIVRAVADNATGDHDLWKRLVGELEMRVRFIVLEKDVEARAMLFDKIRFKDQGLDLVVDHDEFEIGDQPHELPRFGIVIAARLKVGPNTVAKVLCLADVEHLSGLIPVNVDPGTRGQRFEFLRDGHYFDYMPVNTVVTDDVETAARIIREGGTVAFPTETVYGLGANVFDEAAVAKIFEAKRRPADNPLIAHVATIGQISELATEVTESTERFIKAFFPGPLTVVLRKADRVPSIATAGLETVGIRMPRGEVAHRFLVACGVPVVAPSANLSGRPSPTTWQAVLEDLDGRIDCVLRGEPTEIGLESTVIDCTGDVPVLLRQGAVSFEEIRSIVPEARVLKPGRPEENRSPGLRHRHYTPRARVLIMDPRANVADFMYRGGKFAYIGSRSFDVVFTAVKICTSVEEYARSLFEFFRECDRLGVDEIYCEAVEEIGIGAALMDRLKRAAGAVD